MHNKVQRIHNLEKFGPVTNETILITIQVHNRISYLSHLIDSLRHAQNISDALLIVSHDVYNDTINQIVQSIDFCMFLQIFYPHSIQTHPKTFPGDDPKDCPRDATAIEARELQCNNQFHPDMYGHFREARFTQMKHHWWWKLNRIFDQLEATKHHNGFLLLLEEDYFMAEDFIPVLKLLRRQMLASCESCNVMSLGTYTENIFKSTHNKFDVNPWITSKHNMGMAFNRSTWMDIKRCATFFCGYDEYNYDFSLQNVNFNCLEKKLLVAILRGPRVYHIGECGVHHATSDCNSDDKVREVKKRLTTAKSKNLLYPSTLKQGFFLKIPTSTTLTPNGGWGDKRDHNLCLNITLDVG